MVSDELWFFCCDTSSKLFSLCFYFRYWRICPRLSDEHVYDYFRLEMPTAHFPHHTRNKPTSAKQSHQTLAEKEREQTCRHADHDLTRGTPSYQLTEHPNLPSPIQFQLHNSKTQTLNIHTKPFREWWSSKVPHQGHSCTDVYIIYSSIARIAIDFTKHMVQQVLKDYI